MAANSSAIRGVGASLQKRFVKQVQTTRDPPPPLSGFRREVHTSVYDKNIDEHVRPAVVPDYIVQQNSEYWAPHPHTGVFGPPGGSGLVDMAHDSGATAGSGSESVLEQKAFFRAVENLDKPQHY